ncbi:hypothetical protein [Variovorax sp.]|uniref:hypothetical protein n=1 Tax=Variovorax sp. TaxID=1871043 RepID=UPI002D6B3F26|nr:hypothetical protein [Variovorax sp.]HYP85201.1 hypothetical protein [Variovorax sp.]
MTFTEIAETFAQAPSGTDGFKAFGRSALQLMKTDPENAALYFVVGIAAQAYVFKYEDQGVDPELADKAKDTLVEFNQRLLSALSKGPAERLSAANSVAIDYEWNVREF